MDKLEKEYFEIYKTFKNELFNRFETPKELKKLGDLLKYRRLKKELEGLDEEKIAWKLIEKLKNLIIELEKI